MSQTRYRFPALIISLETCKGKFTVIAVPMITFTFRNRANNNTNTLRTWGRQIKVYILQTVYVAVTCNHDGSICYVSGTLAPIVTELASQSDQSHDVRCCDGVSGNTTTTTCGNGTSCTNVCGSKNSGIDLSACLYQCKACRVSDRGLWGLPHLFSRAPGLWQANAGGAVVC